MFCKIIKFRKLFNLMVLQNVSMVFRHCGIKFALRQARWARQEVPWWLCRFFCRDVEGAAREAPLMESEERVARFGRQTIIEQFDSTALVLTGQTATVDRFLNIIIEG